jgi:hypothetical protein
MTTLQDYNLEIKPANFVRGQRLCRLAAKSKGSQIDGEMGWENETKVSIKEIYYVLASTNLWYNEIKYYLNNGTTQYLDPKKNTTLLLKYAQYQLIDGLLFCKNYDGVLLICLEKADIKKVLIELHDGPTGGNFGGDTIAHKILCVD